MPRPIAIFCDFDETAAVQNVARLLLDRFAGGREKPHREAYLAGEISFKEYQERAFHETDATSHEMAAYVRENAALRPGFSECVAAARSVGAAFSIVSAGLDFYIHALLEREGHAGLTVTAVSVTEPPSAQGRFQYDYPWGLGGCGANSTMCKCRTVEAAKDSGATVVFVGDGLTSDACAAAKADVVFARSKLLEHCTATGIPCTAFENLHPLAEFIGSATRRNPQTLMRSGRPTHT